VARRRYYYDRFSSYTRSAPKEVKGGIKAQSRRGGFAGQWWAKRWLQVLESFNIGARLSRGRSYARRGQVAQLHVSAGEIRAKVQGTRSRPYSVVIKLKTLSKKQWKKVAAVLAERPIFSAKLLSGEMPENIEEAFAAAGLSLFPQRKGDLKTDCSCPDWSNPCKHIAAVYYLLAEAFDRDPFLLFTLRGTERDELLQLITGTPGFKKAGGKKQTSSVKKTRRVPGEPLPKAPESFWKTRVQPFSDFGDIIIPPVSGALPKRLGNLPFWRGNSNMQESLEAMYRNASSSALTFWAESAS